VNTSAHTDENATSGRHVSAMAVVGVAALFGLLMTTGIAIRAGGGPHDKGGHGHRTPSAEAQAPAVASQPPPVQYGQAQASQPSPPFSSLFFGNSNKPATVQVPMMDCPDDPETGIPLQPHGTPGDAISIRARIDQVGTYKVLTGFSPAAGPGLSICSGNDPSSCLGADPNAQLKGAIDFVVITNLDPKPKLFFCKYKTVPAT
jgi:hypothetical protein